MILTARQQPQLLQLKRAANGSGQLPAAPRSTACKHCSNQIRLTVQRQPVVEVIKVAVSRWLGHAHTAILNSADRLYKAAGRSYASASSTGPTSGAGCQQSCRSWNRQRAQFHCSCRDKSCGVEAQRPKIKSRGPACYAPVRSASTVHPMHSAARHSIHRAAFDASKPKSRRICVQGAY